MTATIYTTKTCAYCPMVVKWLENKKIPFSKVELDDKPDVRQLLYELTGASTVPITQFSKRKEETDDGLSDDRFIIGWNPAKMAEAIK